MIEKHCSEHLLAGNSPTETTLYLSLALLGGVKKRKKKVYTTPKKKKNKRKPKKVKLAVLKYYKVCGLWIVQEATLYLLLALLGEAKKRKKKVYTTAKKKKNKRKPKKVKLAVLKYYKVRGSWIVQEATLYLLLALLGEAKKRKKKVYTTPKKKNKRKPKKVKLAVLKYYKKMAKKLTAEQKEANKKRRELATLHGSITETLQNRLGDPTWPLFDFNQEFDRLSEKAQLELDRWREWNEEIHDFELDEEVYEFLPQIIKKVETAKKKKLNAEKKEMAKKKKEKKAEEAERRRQLRIAIQEEEEGEESEEEEPEEEEAEEGEEPEQPVQPKEVKLEVEPQIENEREAPQEPQPIPDLGRFIELLQLIHQGQLPAPDVQLEPEEHNQMQLVDEPEDADADEHQPKEAPMPEVLIESPNSGNEEQQLPETQGVQENPESDDDLMILEHSGQAKGKKRGPTGGVGTDPKRHRALVDGQRRYAVYNVTCSDPKHPTLDDIRGVFSTFGMEFVTESDCTPLYSLLMLLNQARDTPKKYSVVFDVSEDSYLNGRLREILDDSEYPRNAFELNKVELGPEIREHRWFGYIPCGNSLAIGALAASVCSVLHRSKRVAFVDYSTLYIQSDTTSRLEPVALESLCGEDFEEVTKQAKAMINRDGRKRLRQITKAYTSPTFWNLD